MIFAEVIHISHDFSSFEACQVCVEVRKVQELFIVSFQSLVLGEPKVQIQVVHPTTPSWGFQLSTVGKHFGNKFSIKLGEQHQHLHHCFFGWWFHMQPSAAKTPTCNFILRFLHSFQGSRGWGFRSITTFQFLLHVVVADDDHGLATVLFGCINTFLIQVQTPTCRSDLR